LPAGEFRRNLSPPGTGPFRLVGPPSSGITGYARDRTRPALEAVGGFARMCVLTAKALFRWPFQWREFILQSWFLIRVAFVPTIMVSIPLTVLLIFTLNILRGVVPYPPHRAERHRRRHAPRPVNEFISRSTNSVMAKT
jgi:hypothetical protein